MLTALRTRAVQAAARPGGQGSQRCRACARTASRAQTRVTVPRRRVEAGFFKFGGKGSEDAGVYGVQKREDYGYDDVEQYFNYMGMLATEGTYDRMEALLNSGLHPVDVLLLMAASENDTPKVQELLRAGASPAVRDLTGKQPTELASKPEVLKLLQEAVKA